MSEFNQARREGVVKSGYDFGSLAEVTHLFGLKTARLFHSVSFRIPGRENGIVCLLSENGGNGWKNVPHYGMESDGRGWREILSIDEYNVNEEVSLKRVQDELADPQERYVFWRESRDGVTWYKFYGVFEIDKVDTNAAVTGGKAMCVYRRKSEEGVCPKSEKGAPYEMDDLKGKVLETDLLDFIPYERTGKKTGEVKVMPGQRFWIAGDTSAGFICKTANKNILPADCQEGDVTFLIPKRDLELGYFKVVGEGKLCEWAIQDMG